MKIKTNKLNAITGFVYAIAGMSFNAIMGSLTTTDSEAISVVLAVLTIVGAFACVACNGYSLYRSFKDNTGDLIDVFISPKFIFPFATIVLILCNFTELSYCASTIKTSAALGSNNYLSALSNGLDTVGYALNSYKYTIMCGAVLFIAVISLFFGASTDRKEATQPASEDKIATEAKPADVVAAEAKPADKPEKKPLQPAHKGILFGGLAILAICAGIIIYFVGFAKTSVDPMEYMNEVKFSGYDGSGHVNNLYIDQDKLPAYAKVNCTDEDNRITQALSGVTFEVTGIKNGELSNGDTIVINAKYDQDQLDANKVKLSKTSKKVKVKGLLERYDAEDFDIETLDELVGYANDEMDDYGSYALDEFTDYTPVGIYYQRSKEASIWGDYDDCIIVAYQVTYDDSETGFMTVSINNIFKGSDLDECNVYPESYTANSLAELEQDLFKNKYHDTTKIDYEF